MKDLNFNLKEFRDSPKRVWGNVEDWVVLETFRLESHSWAGEFAFTFNGRVWDFKSFSGFKKAIERMIKKHNLTKEEGEELTTC